MRAEVVGRPDNKDAASNTAASDVTVLEVKQLDKSRAKPFLTKEWNLANEEGNDAGDMTMLPHVHEPAILANLDERSNRERCVCVCVCVCVCASLCSYAIQPTHHPNRLCPCHCSNLL